MGYNQYQELDEDSSMSIHNFKRAVSNRDSESEESEPSHQKLRAGKLEKLSVSTSIVTDYILNRVFHSFLLKGNISVIGEGAS